MADHRIVELVLVVTRIQSGTEDLRTYIGWGKHC